MHALNIYSMLCQKVLFFEIRQKKRAAMCPFPSYLKAL